MPTREDVLLLGATGKTGQLTLHHLSVLGIPTTLAGRSAKKLADLADSAGLRSAVVRIDDRKGLARAFAGHVVVINCAGPFLRHGMAPLEATLDARLHYLDSSWEQAHLLRAASYHNTAKGRGVAVVPGIGVSPGLTDLVVAASAQTSGRHAPDRVTVHYVEGAGNRMSYGTLLSLAEALKEASFRLCDGALVPMKVGEKRKTVELPGQFGKQQVLLYPGADVVTLSRSYRVRDVEHYFGAEWLTPLIALLSRLPFRPSSRPARAVCKMAFQIQGAIPGGRRGFSQVVELQWEAGRGSRLSRFGLSGEEVYDATARLLATCAAKLIESPRVPTGVLSPGRAFDPDGVLASLRSTGAVTIEPVPLATSANH